MSGNIVVFPLRDSPFVRVKLENPHASVQPIEILALVDTGAYASAIPASFCPFLGHSFEKGLSESLTTGIGAGSIRTFAHSTKLTLLSSMEDGALPAFEPIEFPCGFIEQSLSFMLLGQRDFLRMFQYAQNGKEGWFSLERIEHS